MFAPGIIVLYTGALDNVAVTGFLP